MTTYTTREQAVEAATTQSANMAETWETVEFDGQNCEDVLNEGETCDGWDGISRRCECGNRRVGWTFSEYTKGVWTYYAEAY